MYCVLFTPSFVGSTELHTFQRRKDAVAFVQESGGEVVWISWSVIHRIGEPPVRIPLAESLPDDFGPPASPAASDRKSE